MSNNNAVSAPSPALSGRGSAVKRERPAVEVNTSVAPHDDASRHSTPASANGPEPKKRKTMPGSRGVANLTPEQLAKKRANGMFRSSYAHGTHGLGIALLNIKLQIVKLSERLGSEPSSPLRILSARFKTSRPKSPIRSYRPLSGPRKLSRLRMPISNDVWLASWP